MFNLFAKSETKKYTAVVEEIHNEFFTAGDKILEEAKKIIEESKTISIEKGKRLAELGFKKCPEAVEAISAENKVVLTKNIADLVQYYLVNYPSYKFITEPMVKSICKKYGLVCGNIGLYKGFVPEIKLAAIETFSLKKEDKAEYYFDVSNGGRSELPRFVITEHDLTEYGKRYLIENSGSMAYVTGESGNSPYGTEIFTENCLKEFSGHLFVEVHRADNRGFQICAPLKDMEVPAGKQVSGYRIQNIPDPVVLQPVKGGYLIVCAWGDEASDEIVVNQTSN